MQIVFCVLPIWKFNFNLRITHTSTTPIEFLCKFFLLFDTYVLHVLFIVNWIIKNNKQGMCHKEVLEEICY